MSRGFKGRTVPPLLLLLSFLASPATGAAGDAWDRVQKTGRLTWGCDVTGGAPYTFPDPQNPSHIIGFEVDIMDALSRRLGVKQKMVVVPWDELVPALKRGDFDLAFNGLEVTIEREKVI